MVVAISSKRRRRQNSHEREREGEREREREINALSNVFKRTNQNHGNKTIKLDDNVIV